MAAIFKAENPYSTAPKRFTLKLFTRISKTADPKPARKCRKPEPHVNGDGCDLSAKSEDDSHPIGESHKIPGKRRKVELRPCAERTGSWMSDRHLGHTAHHQQSNHR